MPSRSIIRTGVGPHREPGNRFPAMAAINLLAARAARVQSRRNLSRSLSPKLDHSHSITRFDRSRTGPKCPSGNQQFSFWWTGVRPKGHTGLEKDWAAILGRLGLIQGRDGGARQPAERRAALL